MLCTRLSQHIWSSVVRIPTHGRKLPHMHTQRTQVHKHGTHLSAATGCQQASMLCARLSCLTRGSAVRGM